jgi:hypothetical protein
MRHQSQGGVFMGNTAAWSDTKKSETNKHRGKDAFFTSAEELADQIKGKIRRVTQGRVKNLDVFLTGTHVVLEGFCSSFHPFQLAQHAAMEATDDLLVDNQIDVG